MEMKVAGYSKREETLNYITHFLAFLLSLVGGYFAFLKAQNGGFLSSLAVLIFSLCLSFTFFASTLYHASWGSIKTQFKKLDHIAIFVMMLGIYLAITTFSDAPCAFKIGFLIFIFAFALVGVLLKIFVSSDGTKKWSILMYIGFGASVFLIFPFLKLGVIISLLCAGIFDLIGIAFYVRKNIEFTHFIWHLFSIFAGFFDWYAVWLSIE